MVRRGAYAAIRTSHKGIVIHGAATLRNANTIADLKALHGGDTEHRFREVGFELIEDRLSQAGRHAARPYLDDPTQRVELTARLLHQRHHLLGHGRIWAA